MRASNMPPPPPGSDRFGRGWNDGGGRAVGAAWHTHANRAGDLLERLYYVRSSIASWTRTRRYPPGFIWSTER